MAPSPQIARPDAKSNIIKEGPRLHAQKPRYYLDLRQSPCGALDRSLNLRGLREMLRFIPSLRLVEYDCSRGGRQS